MRGIITCMVGVPSIKAWISIFRRVGEEGVAYNTVE